MGAIARGMPGYGGLSTSGGGVHRRAGDMAADGVGCGLCTCERTRYAWIHSSRMWAESWRLLREITGDQVEKEVRTRGITYSRCASRVTAGRQRRRTVDGVGNIKSL